MIWARLAAAVGAVLAAAAAWLILVALVQHVL